MSRGGAHSTAKAKPCQRPWAAGKVAWPVSARWSGARPCRQLDEGWAGARSWRQISDSLVFGIKLIFFKSWENRGALGRGERPRGGARS